MDGTFKIVLKGHFRVCSKQDGWVGVRGRDGRNKIVLEGNFRV